MQLKELNNLTEKFKLPKYRLKQIIKAIYQDNVSCFSEITTLPKDLREKLNQEMSLLSFETEEVLASENKKSYKALLKLDDFSYIETVLLNTLKGQWSVCVSSQVGCVLGCRFCATGELGFTRNLTHEEITDQILFWQQYLKKENISGKLNHIVFMGMGEPFMNYEEVSKAIKKLTDPELFGFASRHISVSTSGVVEGIKKLASDFPQINLAISIITADDEKRSELMPINKKHNLEKIKSALDYYFKKANRKVFFEYIIIKDVNDTFNDADILIKFIKSNSRSDLIHVNLIQYNTTTPGMQPADKETAERLKEFIEKRKVSVTIRRSLGEEIQGACGQLAGK